MVEVGILREDDHVELIEGEIVATSPIGRRHAACVRKLTHRLDRLLGDLTRISIQNPIAIPNWSEPNPDVALLVPRSDYYATAHPVARQIQILIEVADTSLGYDTQVKVPLYARAGIREVWVVDPNARQVLAHTRPRDGRYSRTHTYSTGDTFASQRFPGVVFLVDDLLP